MKKHIALIIAFSIAFSPFASARDMQRYSKLPSCSFAESLSSIDSLEKQGYTILLTPTIVNTPYGNGMDFGSDSEKFGFTVPNNGQFNFGDTNDFSIVVRAKFKATPTTETMVATGGTSNTAGFAFWVNETSFLALTTHNGTSATAVNSTVTPVIADIWQLFTVTVDRDGNTIFYINETPQVKDSSTARNVDTTESLYVGVRPPAGGFNEANVQISMFALFDRILTATEVSNLHLNKAFDYEKNLISAWDMSDINPPDVGWRGLSNDGTGTGLDSTNLVSGHNGGTATNFTGSPEVVTMSQPALLPNGIVSYSVSLWAKPTTLDAGAFMGAFVTSELGQSDFITGMLIGHDHRPGNGAIEVKGPFGGSAVDGYFVLDKWQFVTVTYDIGGTCNIYRNGVFFDSVSASANADTKSEIGQIGARYLTGTTNNFWNGCIDEVRIYNKALTYTEVEDLFIRGRGVE